MSSKKISISMEVNTNEVKITEWEDWYTREKHTRATVGIKPPFDDFVITLTNVGSNQESILKAIKDSHCVIDIQVEPVRGKIKHCPFCGSWEVYQSGNYEISCGECGITVLAGDSEKDLYDKWNRRT